MPIIKFKEINGKECIGELDYDIEKMKKGNMLRLKLLYLEEEYRGKGYGRVIMEDFIKKAKNMGCKGIIINLTKPDYDYYSTYEQRRGFFEHFGFEFDEEGDFAKLDIK